MLRTSPSDFFKSPFIARVCREWEDRSDNNSGGLRFVLITRQGIVEGIMTASAFSQQGYFPLITGNCYRITKAKVVREHLAPRVIAEIYHLKFTEETIIQFARDDHLIPLHSFNEVSFDCIHLHTERDQLIDIIGRVHEIHLPHDHTVHCGIRNDRPTVTLMNSRNETVKITVLPAAPRLLDLDLIFGQIMPLIAIFCGIEIRGSLEAPELFTSFYTSIFYNEETEITLLRQQSFQYPACTVIRHCG